MLTTRPAHHLHRAAVLVLIFGLAAALFGWWQAEGSLHRSNDSLLRDDGNQASLLVDSLSSIFGNPPTELGPLVTPFGVHTASFDAAAAKDPAAKAGGAIALLHRVGAHLQVVASVGTLHRSFGGPSDRALISLLRSQNTYAAAGHTSRFRFVSQIYGPQSVRVPAGFALYVEQPIADIPASGVFEIPGQLFEGVDGAVYIGSVQPQNLVLSTATAMPLVGQVSVSSIGNSDAVLTSRPTGVVHPGLPIIILRAKGNLSGTSTALFPVLLLIVGMGATLIVFFLLEIALRRRDHAFDVAQSLRESNEELDHKNVELDQALRRQAEAEQSLLQAQRMEAVGQLAGGIAHDFNNLLHVILSYSSFLADEAAESETMQADLAEIQTAAHRAAELTRQLLIFSRTDVSRATALDVNAIVNNAERILRRALGEDVSFTCVTSEADCHVMADAAELDQVLMNLTTNARDAMPQGGSLEISVKQVEEDDGKGLLPIPYVRIDVRDNGDGMPEEVAAKAFDPFFTTKEPGRGTGLGLAMVYGIVKRWEGEAAITTALGEGTTVTMCFPVASCREDEYDTEHVGGAAIGGDETILLVEDEESVLRSTSRILTTAGYTVVSAANALEAARAFDRSSIDAVVTDVIMPGGVSGKQLADSLRCGHPNLPVVFVSGYSADTITERGVLPAQTHMVKKPFSPDELLLAVREAISQDASRSAMSG